ncbi:hypothetical protein KEM55_002551 [Ascosphaera atra]|nr:hypothetical protein KEM55_002551 [Ascosphaera atra]
MPTLGLAWSDAMLQGAGKLVQTLKEASWYLRYANGSSMKTFSLYRWSRSKRH